MDEVSAWDEYKQRLWKDEYRLPSTLTPMQAFRAGYRVAQKQDDVLRTIVHGLRYDDKRGFVLSGDALDAFERYVKEQS